MNDACGFGSQCQMFRPLVCQACLYKFFITVNSSINPYIHISLLASYHINKQVVMIPGRQVQICRATAGNLGKLKTIGTFFKPKPSGFEHLFIKRYSDITVMQCKTYFLKIICFIRNLFFNCEVNFIF